MILVCEVLLRLDGPFFAVLCLVHRSLEAFPYLFAVRVGISDSSDPRFVERALFTRRSMMASSSTCHVRKYLVFAVPSLSYQYWK